MLYRFGRKGRGREGGYCADRVKGRGAIIYWGYMISLCFVRQWEKNEEGGGVLLRIVEMDNINSCHLLIVREEMLS